jgi:hypothetical protein
MFADALLMLSDSQPLTGTGAVSANTIDLGNPTVKRDVGTGEPLVLVVATETALVGAGGSLTAEVLQSDNADLSSPDVIASSGPILAAALPIGSVVQVAIPEGRITKRYLGAKLTLAGTTPTLTVNAFIQPSSMASQAAPRHYAKGYTV